MAIKSGFISVVGRPNVGKSTLTNAITGNKISIVTSKPQTTRNTIKSILTTADYQMIFIDTPGIHKPRNMLGRYMVDVAVETLKNVDVIIFVVEADKPAPGTADSDIAGKIAQAGTPSILLINKIDLLGNKSSLLPLISEYEKLARFESVIPASSLTGEGMDLLKEEILKILPEGPMYFPEDMVTDQPERILAAEKIREKLFEKFTDEIPYGIGIEVVKFEENQEKRIIHISANIYCEKKSHKGMIIGKNGAVLKEIGTLARKELEALLGIKIFLEMWVKTKEDWRNNSQVLRTLGYS